MTLPELLKEHGIGLTLTRRRGYWSAGFAPGRRGAYRPEPWYAVYSAICCLRVSDLPPGCTYALWTKLTSSAIQALLGEGGSDR